MANSMKKKDWMIQQFFRMWPRALFHSKNGKAYLEKHLNGFGVYVLYRDDHPYYIGKTINKTLIERLSQHALKPNARYYNFWNYFSAFVLAKPQRTNEIEGVLIAAMPTANGANPKLPKEKIPRQVRELMKRMRHHSAFGSS